MRASTRIRFLRNALLTAIVSCWAATAAGQANNGCGAGAVPARIVGWPSAENDIWFCITPTTTFPTLYEPPTFPNSGGGGGACTNCSSTTNPSEDLVRGQGDDGDNDGQSCDGNPVSIASGNKYQAETDFAGVGRLPLLIRRHYNSLEADTPKNKGVFGQGWSSNLLERIIGIEVSDPNNRRVLIENESGFRMQLKSVNGGPWLRTNGKEEPFIYDSATDSWLWLDNGLRKSFLSDGELFQVRHPSGETLTYEYRDADRFTTGNQAGSLRPYKIVHSSGRELTLAWTSLDRISRITDPAGLAYLYSYDSRGNLSTVSYPTPGGNTGTITYNYEYPTGVNRNALTGKVFSPSTVEFANWLYDTSGRAVRSEHAGASERVDFSYVSSTATQVARKTTNARGKDTNYTFQLIGGRMRAIAVSGAAQGSCLATNATTTYDAYGFYDKLTDREGNVTDIDRDQFGKIRKTTKGFGTTDARTTRYEWDPISDSPTLIDTLLLETSIDYDNVGLVKSITRRNKAGYGVPNQARTTSYTYAFYANGTMKKTTIDGPRNDIVDDTVLNYDSSGRLSSVVNAVNHATLFQNYDAYGRAGRIVYPSGLVRDLTYHPNGSVLSATDQVGGVARTTSFAYYQNGDLKTVTEADGSITEYDFDDARRLVNVAERRLATIINDGDRQQSYEYDLDSNVKREYITRTTLQWVLVPGCDPFLPPFPECRGSFQPVETRVRETDYQFDALSRLTAITNGNGEIERFTYDKSDRLKSIVDGFGRSTTLAYNSQDEVGNTTYRDTGTSQVTHDANGSVSAARDALSQWTYYQRDGFGQVWTSTSPATGTTHYVYDEAGNLKQKTDARGIVKTYGYDALNRLVTSKAGTLPTSTFTYDTNRKGYLYRVSDQAGTHTYLRNSAGEMTSKSSVVSGTTLTMTYTYDVMGRVNVMTYPSGLNVDYDYNVFGDVEKIRAWSTGLSARDVVKQIKYFPWGPVDSFRYGNYEFRREYRDKSYRATKILSGSHINRPYYYDANGNIVQTGAFTRLYSYDEMDRLKSHAGPDGNTSYTYDLNGNRDQVKKNGTITNYNYNAAKTRLLTQTGGTSESRGYDANGNTTRIGSRYFYHDHDNRFWRYQSSGQTVTYTHNAFGARMMKQVGSTTTKFVYDGANLMHERTGSTNRDYIYLDGQIVGLVKSNVLYYVHNDHLGRPEVVTNTAKSKVWEAQNNAFGNVPTLDQIGGFNVGFPGQYFDAESSVNYNYFRTYDPGTGRYLESDPIGLLGGLNTYSYVRENPLGNIDPFGLAADTLDTGILSAIARGDINKLRTIVEATSDPSKLRLINAAIKRLNTRAGDMISGSLKRSRSFHEDLAEKSFGEICKMASRRGVDQKRAQQMKKLIEQAERLRKKNKG